MASSTLARRPGHDTAATDEQLAQVVRAIRQTPIVDNHAHPLLKPEAVGRHPLLSIVSEAHGDALLATVTALPHHIAVRNLSSVLGCPPTWAAVEAAVAKRRADDYEAWVARCLAGLETLLLDDGLDNRAEAFDYAWHDAFTRSPCRRIVRIETLAAEIIDRHCVAYAASRRTDHIFDSMLEEFDVRIQGALADPAVVAFKSVVCYRTGLAVPRAVDIAAARKSFCDILKSHSASGAPFRRLQHVGLSDLFVHRTAIHVRDGPGPAKKPIQFHTGLGDNDITLAKSSPAHLQEFIRTYATVPIVLLHSGYPYMREAGYLAAVYTNVYVDIGEVFPAVGRDGQEAIVREIFELCPWSKVMWSTDGHWLPETYLLACIQVRDVLETVLCDYVRKGDLSWQSAVQLTQDILFQNANRVYELGLPFRQLEVPKAVDDGGSRSLAAQDHDQSETKTPLDLWKAFLQNRSPPDFVRISWVDYTALPRMRMIPFRRFNRLVEQGQPLDIGITKACLGLLQNDVCIPGVPATGEYRLHPDLSSLAEGPIEGHANLYGTFRESDGAPAPLCPRTQLIRAVDASAAAGVSYWVGFEIEFVLLDLSDPYEGDQLRNDGGHAWSTSRFPARPSIATFLRDVVQDMDNAGIEVEQVHAESAPGQFEIVLPAQAPVPAVDALYHAREILVHRAASLGLRFTLHPKPFEEACGTAAHVHLSLATTDGRGDDPGVYEAFYAGILTHLRGLAALTYSNKASYERLVDGAWAGGRFVTWGTQNRETPLRKIRDSHWELKCHDGLANAYLSLAAVLQAGLAGLRDQTPLVWAECTVDPATLDDAGWAQLGITNSLPASLEEALTALEEDTALCDLVGRAVVERYVAVKQEEMKAPHTSYTSDLRKWLIERY